MKCVAYKDYWKNRANAKYKLNEQRDLSDIFFAAFSQAGFYRFKEKTLLCLTYSIKSSTINTKIVEAWCTLLNEIKKLPDLKVFS
jgi:hypothetical protein